MRSAPNVSPHIIHRTEIRACGAGEPQDEAHKPLDAAIATEPAMNAIAPSSGGVCRKLKRHLAGVFTVKEPIFTDITAPGSIRGETLERAVTGG